MKSENIQTFVAHRPANDHVAPVRDLIREGSHYANTRKAFWRFTRDTRKAETRGFTPAQPGDRMEEEEDDSEGQQEDYEPTEDDLRADDEEFFDMAEPAQLLARAMEIVDDVMAE
ncbi:hypothetical protein FB451DRAFT_1411417 [Mycena latifolia]|nr:hypothetical protein FB451DRAFT_1411417 [Mycena latifolia]